MRPLPLWERATPTSVPSSFRVRGLFPPPHYLCGTRPLIRSFAPPSPTRGEGGLLAPIHSGFNQQRSIHIVCSIAHLRIGDVAGAAATSVVEMTAALHRTAVVGVAVDLPAAAGRPRRRPRRFDARPDEAADPTAADTNPDSDTDFGHRQRALGPRAVAGQRFVLIAVAPDHRLPVAPLLVVAPLLAFIVVVDE